MVSPVMPEILRHSICPFAEIPNPGARGFSLPGGRFPDECFLVRQGESLYAYHNVCPHAGNFLNWNEHTFLTQDKSRIICAAHGALFDPASGVCVGGPCLGRALDALPVTIEAGMVVVYFTRAT